MPPPRRERDRPRRSIVAERFPSTVVRPRLLGGAKGDPALFVDLSDHNRSPEALLFDCGGSAHHLTPPEVARLTHVFVSHTHMDHWMGFDGVLRKLVAGEERRRLRLFGPPGFIRCVQGRLSGYIWNLLDRDKLCFAVHEVDGDLLRGAELRPAGDCTPAACFERPLAEGGGEGEPPGEPSGSPHLRTPQSSPPLLVETPTWRVRVTALDHKVPSLAFAFEHQDYVEVRTEALAQHDLPTGPWLRDLKERAQSGAGAADLLPEELRRDGLATWGDALATLLSFRPGERLAYVTDCKYHADTEARVRALARRADLFFCEASFLEENGERAALTHHLTAAHAGRLARAAEVKTLLISHFSAIYAGRERELLDEARAEFERTWIYS